MPLPGIIIPAGLLAASAAGGGGGGGGGTPRQAVVATPRGAMIVNMIPTRQEALAGVIINES